MGHCHHEVSWHSQGIVHPSCSYQEWTEGVWCSVPETAARICVSLWLPECLSFTMEPGYCDGSSTPSQSETALALRTTLTLSWSQWFSLDCCQHLSWIWSIYQEEWMAFEKWKVHELLLQMNKIFCHALPAHNHCPLCVFSCLFQKNMSAGLACPLWAGWILHHQLQLLFWICPKNLALL